MALILPGLSTQALLASPAAPPTGIAKLDARFQAILNTSKAPEAHQKLLGDAGCESSEILAHIGRDKAELDLFIKRVLGLDPATNGDHAIPAARIHIACTACKKREEVETEAAAHRAVHNLPVQLSLDDHAAAREAYEKLRRADGKQPLPDHKIPSELFYEKKVGEMETFLKSDKLTSVTNLAQEV